MTTLSRYAVILSIHIRRPVRCYVRGTRSWAQHIIQSTFIFRVRKLMNRRRSATEWAIIPSVQTDQRTRNLFERVSRGH